ncbi:hypothetical protein Tco_1088627 [Tanacetum coccineum]
MRNQIRKLKLLFLYQMIDTPYPMEVDGHINLLNEYVVLDRKLDTPYPMGVDTPYQIRRIGPPGYGVSDLLDTAYRTYWVRRIELLRYGVLGSLGTAYWASWVRSIG